MGGKGSGRRPMPAAHKKLTGRSPVRDSGGRPIPEYRDQRPAFERRAPEQPAHLSGEAKAEWDRAVSVLEPLDILTLAHEGGLSCLCMAWSFYIQAMQDVQERGVVVQGPRGGLRPNPSLALARGFARDYRSWCQEFGLTPRAGERLDLPPPVTEADDDDDLELRDDLLD